MNCYVPYLAGRRPTTGVIMHAVIRSYSRRGREGVVRSARAAQGGCRQLLRGSRGFRAHTLMRTADGCVSVTACADKAGTDASLKAASSWISQNGANLGASAPAITEETVIVQLG